MGHSPSRANRLHMRVGDCAVVVKSWSSDVVPGTQGVVVKRMPGGYALSVTGYFSDATGHRQIETRYVFFNHKELRRSRSRRRKRSEKPT